MVMSYTETVDKVALAAKQKVLLLNKGISKYFIASILSGIYISFSTLFVIIIGSITANLGNGFHSIFMGLAFAGGLSIVIMAGAELFTGINFIGSIGFLTKSIKFTDLYKIFIISYIGNFIGSVFLGILFYFINMDSIQIENFIVNYATSKISLSPLNIIARGFLCNILVCLAVLCSIKLKTESAKLIIVFWCLFIFITSRYEHSIANMSIFTVAYLYDSIINIPSIIYNLVFATVGNMLGGFFLALSYWYIGHEK